MRVDVATTADDVAEIIWMAREHPNPEYDCSFEEFANILRMTVMSPALRGWLLRNDKETIGYSFGTLAKNLVHQINILDVYLKPESRGKGNILQFIPAWDEWAREGGVKRVVWMSRRPLKVFRRYLSRDVNTYYTYISEA